MDCLSAYSFLPLVGGLPDGSSDGSLIGLLALPLVGGLPDGWSVTSPAVSPNGCGWQILGSPVTICGVLLVIGSVFFLAGLRGLCFRVFQFSSFRVFGFQGTGFSNFNNVTNWTLWASVLRVATGRRRQSTGE